PEAHACGGDAQHEGRLEEDLFSGSPPGVAHRIVALTPINRIVTISTKTMSFDIVIAA
ncbi:MAG: hypothetical protein RLZZ539_868, partial [Pseudomonadota bacterium]